MNVILNIEAIKFPLTGIGRYTYELAKALKSNSIGFNEIKLMLGYKFCSEIPLEQHINKSSSLHQGLKSYIQKRKLFSEIYRLVYPQLKALALKNYSDFIYHSPNFYLPPFSGKSIATFHDLSMFTWPQCHPKERVRFMQKELLLTIKRADALITDSEFTRIELANYFNLSLEKIFAIPLASSGEFYIHNKDDVMPILTQYGLEYKKYSLFTGSIEPRKNLLTLIHAYQRLPDSLRQEYPLVISGYKGWESKEVHDKMKQGESEGWLRYLGFVPANYLPAIFSGAQLFMFPSLYEGFGLPVLEAMASGVPVICSNAASLPEITGNAALMFDALDDETLTELLKQGLQDESWRKLAIELGLLRSQQFSWDRCALETINVYQKV